MIVRDDRTSLEITLRELAPVGTQSEGDLGVNVAVSNGAFAGRNDTVWIGRDDWQGFLGALKELDRTRRGDARVRSMSPDELELVVLATDRAGHMAAEGWLGRTWYARDAFVHDRVSFGIEIDPSLLPGLIRQFEALATAG
jgi:hypothetical protein